MNNKLYKILFTIFTAIPSIYVLLILYFADDRVKNPILSLLVLVITGTLVIRSLLNLCKNKRYSNKKITVISKICSVLAVLLSPVIYDQTYLSSSSGVDFHSGINSFSFLPAIILFYFLTVSILNIVERRKYSRKWKNVLYRILSIICIVVSSLFFINNFDAYPMFVTVPMILVTLLIIFTFRKVYIINKKQYTSIDYLPMIITLTNAIAIIISIIWNKSNLTFAMWGFVMPHSATLPYYLSFIIISYILTWLYILIDPYKEEKRELSN